MPDQGLASRLALQLALARVAARVLAERLGWREAGRVLLGVGGRLAAGEPFGREQARGAEAESRAQLGPAVVVYRELVRRGHGDARAVVGQIVHDGALVYLGHVIGPLDRDALGAMDERARAAWLDALGARFPNATLRWEATGPDVVSFRVSACRFVSLCHELGVPELAPLFCAGDATYFGTSAPNVSLTRPHTLAEGGPDCPFTLRWSD